MAYVEFKTKAVDIYNMDDSFSHKEIFLPKLWKHSHVKEGQSHRMFSGRVSNEVIDVRVRMLLKSVGISHSIRVDQQLDNVSISGDYMLTVKINLPESC